MTVVTMSLYSSAQTSGHSHPGHTSIRPAHSILSATLTGNTSHSLLAASQAKGKLGFSIDSLVGDKSPKREPRSPEQRRGGSQSPRDRSPLYRARSPSPSEADFCRRSPSPGTGHYARSDSPPSPSLIRPIPTSGSLSGSPSLSTQSYLDQLAQLKAFQGAAAAVAVAAAPSSTAGLLPPGLTLPGLHPVLSAALPRPPANLPTGLPPFLGLPGQHPSLPGQQLPREYPLYPWFLNRNRFPGGKQLHIRAEQVDHF